MSRLFDLTIAENIAVDALDIEAVTFDFDESYTFSKGWKSPIYCDNRQFQSHIHEREYLSSVSVDAIKVSFPKVDVIASVANAAVPHGYLAAYKARLPHIYINKDAKGHGKKKIIEGDFEPGQKVVVFEDLFSTGESAYRAVKAATKEGLDVIGVVGIMTYGFPQVDQLFASEKYEIVTLTDYPTVIAIAMKHKLIPENQFESLVRWQKDPANWTSLKPV